MNEHHEVNRRWWDEVAPVHAASAFYDVDGFLAGGSSLGAVEREAVGDVAGKRLLHPQCHFGLDTLSWARLGAEAVGVDFSPEAVALARDLARRAGLAGRARFVEADVTTVGAVPGGPFDVVFVSFGTVVWLADLGGWARAIAANLAPDGFFYFLDSHPATAMFDEETEEPTVAYDYFRGGEPLCEPGGGADYADRGYAVRSESRQFTWSLAAIFSALEAAGLTVFEVREYPFGAWRQFPDMTKSADGYWRRRDGAKPLPLLLGFKARR